MFAGGFKGLAASIAVRSDPVCRKTCRIRNVFPKAHFVVFHGFKNLIFAFYMQGLGTRHSKLACSQRPEASVPVSNFCMLFKPRSILCFQIMSIGQPLLHHGVLCLSVFPDSDKGPTTRTRKKHRPSVGTQSRFHGSSMLRVICSTMMALNPEPGDLLESHGSFRRGPGARRESAQDARGDSTKGSTRPVSAYLGREMAQTQSG